MNWNRLLFYLRQSDSPAPVTLGRCIFWLFLGASTLLVGQFELYRHAYRQPPDGPFPLPYLDSNGFLGHLYSSALLPFWVLFTFSLIFPLHRISLKKKREYVIWIATAGIAGADFCNKMNTHTNVLQGLSGTIVGVAIALWLNHRMIASDIWIGRILVLPSFLWPMLFFILGTHFPVLMQLLNNWINQWA